MTNLIQFADIINESVSIHSRHFSPRWYANFDYCETQEGDHLLKSECGNGETPMEALRDYAEKIRGKRLIFHATRKDMRREFIVPSDLEA